MKGISLFDLIVMGAAVSTVFLLCWGVERAMRKEPPVSFYTDREGNVVKPETMKAEEFGAWLERAANDDRP